MNGTVAGAILAPYPTTQAISIEWPITGDDNLNGAVSVRYRRPHSGWKTGFPLRRIPAGQNLGDEGYAGGTYDGSWPNEHSGSLFDLEPGTLYEIELTLTDPDGGSVRRTIGVSTRPIPVTPRDAVVRRVTPATLQNELNSANPGDFFWLAPGTYPKFAVKKSGTPGHPIVLRGASVDGVVIDGDVDLTSLGYVHLENLTVKGSVRLEGSSNMVVRETKVRTTGDGITFLVDQQGHVPENNYIVDNDLIGAAPWVNEQLSDSGYDNGEGIRVTGPGHVVCFNRVKAFRDNISLMEDSQAYEQTSIDICNNYIEEATDDAIEADSAMGNVRVMRNYITRSFTGLSSQPNLGGPTYYIRNVMYDIIYGPFKLHNGTVGDLGLHNTVVKSGDAFRNVSGGKLWSRAFFRNNILIGGVGTGEFGPDGYTNGTGLIFNWATPDLATSSFDYDGLGSIGTGFFKGVMGTVTFSSLAELQANTTEVHAVQLDLSAFAAPVVFPEHQFDVSGDADLRLAPRGPAVDKGVALPGINDWYSGAAPDLGAYEVGAPVPTYGPRAACHHHF